MHIVLCPHEIDLAKAVDLLIVALGHKIMPVDIFHRIAHECCDAVVGYFLIIIEGILDYE